MDVSSKSPSSRSTVTAPGGTRAFRHAFTLMVLLFGLWLMHIYLRVLPET
jgi:hypothetical protein